MDAVIHQSVLHYLFKANAPHFCVSKWTLGKYERWMSGRFIVPVAWQVLFTFPPVLVYSMANIFAMNS